MTPASCPGVLISLPLLLGAASLSQAQQRLVQRGRVLLQCSAIPCLWLSPLPHSHQPSPFFRTHSSPCLLNHFFPFWYFFFPLTALILPYKLLHLHSDPPACFLFAPQPGAKSRTLGRAWGAPCHHKAFEVLSCSILIARPARQGHRNTSNGQVGCSARPKGTQEQKPQMGTGS